MRSLADQWAHNYGALLLDNDGTCGMTEELHARIGCKILVEHGIDITYEERFSLMGYGEHGIFEHLASQGRIPANSPLTKERFKELQSEHFTRDIATIVDPSIIIRPGISEMVDAFNRAGKPVMIVSNTPADAVIAVQKAAGLMDRINPDLIITFDDIQRHGLQKKPAPDAYILAMKMCNLPEGERFLAIEDSRVGAEAAISAGIDTIQILYSKLNQVPLPGAAFVVSDVDNILTAQPQIPPHQRPEARETVTSGAAFIPQAAAVASPS